MNNGNDFIEQLLPKINPIFVLSNIYLSNVVIDNIIEYNSQEMDNYIKLGTAIYHLDRFLIFDINGKLIKKKLILSDIWKRQLFYCHNYPVTGVCCLEQLKCNYYNSSINIMIKYKSYYIVFYIPYQEVFNQRFIYDICIFKNFKEIYWSYSTSYRIRTEQLADLKMFSLDIKQKICDIVINNVNMLSTYMKLADTNHQFFI